MDKKHSIRFQPGGKEVKVASCESILAAARKAGVGISSPCGGNGSCGKCRVIVEQGRVLSNDLKDGMFLACDTYPLSDLKVRVPLESIGAAGGISGQGKETGAAFGREERYGLAVDVGTSTIAAYFVDLEKKEVVSYAVAYNKQAAYGADVVSRMDYAKKHGTQKLNAAVVDTINDVTADLLKGREDVRVDEVWAAGNTVMTYLLMNKDPSIIKREPQLDAYKATYYAGAKTLGLLCGGTLKTLPGIAGYVGGDVVGDLVSSGMHESKKTSMMMDVGTNGEVVLGNREWLVACSTSAGPAFEGAGISCGMLASRGAIERVKKDGNGIEYSTIGNASPLGICGSGLIDLVAQLFLDGTIDPSGKLADGRKEYVVVPKEESGTGKDIAVSGRDIRNLIFSKAAIYAGAYTLTRTGIPFSGLEKIYIAGGFGLTLDIENAITIGLLPDVPREKYEFIGNGSLKGAFLALTSEEKRREALSTADKATYMDLAGSKDYAREYLDAAFLPHRDATRFPSVER